MIYIAFEDFWNGFDINDNFITEALKSITDVEVIDVTKEPKRKKEVQYLFYSVFSYRFLEYDCIRIFFTGENAFPDFNLCDYAMGFEHMDVGDRYLRYPLYVACYQEDVNRMLAEKQCDERESFCAMVISNGSSASRMRDVIFDAISEYKMIDSGGRYRNNIGIPEGVKDKQTFLQKYKFSLAIENVSHRGYCTEKIVQSFAAGTIPIYWGDPMIETYFNPKSFINVHNFETMEKLIDYIKYVDENEDVYQKIRNESAVCYAEYLPEAYKERLVAWLRDIIEQPYEKAGRRNSEGWCKNYQRERKKQLAYSLRWERVLGSRVFKHIAKFIKEEE